MSMHVKDQPDARQKRQFRTTKLASTVADASIIPFLNVQSMKRSCPHGAERDFGKREWTLKSVSVQQLEHKSFY